MNLLVRKINRAKWMQNDILCGEEVSADAITNCMKTKGNALSTWQISDQNEIADAVLAIVSFHEHLDTIDVVCLNPSCLEKVGVKFQPTQVNTPVKDLIERHVDICNLTYRSLGIVAEQIVNVIREDKVVRYTKGSIRKLLKTAIDLGRIEIGDLHNSIYNEL